MITINKMKKQHTEWGKMFSNKTSDKELISKTGKALIQPNTKNEYINNLIKKWTEHLNRHFSNRIYIQMAKRHLKGRSTPLSNGMSTFLTVSFVNQKKIFNVN